MKKPHALYSVTRLGDTRLAIYGPELVYPSPATAQISFWVEIGAHAPVHFRERVIDGELDLGPDALAHTDAGSTVHQACCRVGVCFYRTCALLSRAIEGYTRAERISDAWLRGQLRAQALELRPSQTDAGWEIVHAESVVHHESLRAAAASIGVLTESL